MKIIFKNVISTVFLPEKAELSLNIIQTLYLLPITINEYFVRTRETT